ncbi:GXWXG domain-containing protein [Arthrobacter jiangjiafuii]|uniref:GXWXG domain-containing protein n=1 Tax=Arthrobacter jiangjiafuii TaxID=2817475 RepID=A0A975R2N9_9MICC|nr:GXWXG domain-containing protein [Arthrobacter jiangjiafuii]MBP3043036.1 GXWXG domain-containing protein [Arthrobacter jiangjiafuii]QWC11734.1 GXWXG domain-containing protein [Arthrobacter jiangjiafuii]
MDRQRRPTGHPLDGALSTLGWHGKRLEGPSAAHPLVFESTTEGRCGHRAGGHGHSGQAAALHVCPTPRGGEQGIAARPIVL